MYTKVLYPNKLTPVQRSHTDQNKAVSVSVHNNENSIAFEPGPRGIPR